MIRGLVLMAVGFAMLAGVGLYIAQAYAKAPPPLAHVIRATHSGPRRVYFCATHTRDYNAFVECLRNV